MNNVKQMTAYQKTELLLGSYKQLEKGVIYKQTLIEEFEQEGLPESSKSIVKYSSGIIFDNSTDFEKKEELIESLESSIKVTKLLLKLIDKALKEISTDSYYDIIRLKYFEGLTIEKIAELIFCEISTVSRNRKRLVTQLSAILFSDEVIKELYGLLQ